MDALIIFCLFVIGIAVSILFFLLSSKVGVAKADSEVPVIREIRTFNLKPGDVLVVKFSGRILPEIRSSIKEQLSNVLPSGIKTLVIDEYLDIDTVLKCESSEVKEGNTDAQNSNENSPEPFPLSEVKLNDDSGKLGRPMALIVPVTENQVRVRVVLWRNILACIPGFDSVNDAHLGSLRKTAAYNIPILLTNSDNKVYPTTSRQNP